MSEVPLVVRVVNPLTRKLLDFGVPMGPNRLITIPGRKTGIPRSTGVAVVEVDERRWVIGSYGNVNWVRNLRQARKATLGTGNRIEHVIAMELDREEAARFFRGTLIPYAKALPLMARIWVPKEILQDPGVAARTRPVFELRPSVAR